MLTYYITDRTQFPGTEAERRARLLRNIRSAAAAGVDFIQLREKDLSIRDLELLARQAMQIIRAEGPARLLINHRTDVALACGADGVHLTGDDIAASDARALAAGVHAERKAERQSLVAVSCHSAQQVRLAEAHGADFAVLAPIFEKIDAETNQTISPGIGLDELRRAAPSEPAVSDPQIEAGDARQLFPVFALGGIDLERAALCAAAGAAGIAGIRIFQQPPGQQAPDLVALVRSLRAL